MIWNIKTIEKSIFITFDDGPTPVVTPYVLDLLDKFNFKATFFCIGNNVEKFPDIYSEILKRGHQTANHTFNHINGFKSNNSLYFENIKKCSDFVISSYFRPPHGKLKFSQISFLKNKYKIVMWTLLAEDWNNKMNVKLKLAKLIKNTRSGDIIVFHDSLKAQKNLEFLLPNYLKFLSENGFTSLVFK